MRLLTFLAVSLAGGILGGLLIGLTRPTPAPRAPREASAPDLSRENERLEKLEDRVAALESDAGKQRARETRAPAAPKPMAPTASTRQPTGKASESAAPAGKDSAAKGKLTSASAVLEGVLGGTFGNDQANLLFNRLTQNPEQIDAVIEALKKKVADDPKNADLQTALATAYVGKLVTVPPGPQQGSVWADAVNAYDAALQVNPDHWQARFGKAFGTSMIPAFLGQRPEAIRQFEDLMDRQERTTPEPNFVQTYFRLGQLYSEAGNQKKAQEIWQRGLRYFPDNAQLKGALAVNTQK